MNDLPLRISLAAAMELGFVRGYFYRGARLHCVNLLQQYPDGCKANCAFCGLSRQGGQGEATPSRRFIRVRWPSHAAGEIIDRLQATRPADVVRRICLSMVTHPRAVADAVALTARLSAAVDLPLSVLIAPSVMGRADLEALRLAGAQRIGVAIDCATPELFDRLRGRGVKGPHRWDRYWDVYAQALEVFGAGMAGAHLICGLGETERELAQAIQRSRDLGGFTHLFSFFPEAGSALADHQPPPLGQYRRIQVARWLIDKDLARQDGFAYDAQGRIVDFGVDGPTLEAVLTAGACFMTSGCPGQGLEAACNRPFANERPGEAIRNFPFAPEAADLALCRAQFFGPGRPA